MLTLGAAENTDSPPTSLIVLILILVTGGVIYTFGYARAVLTRANKDYKATKAAVPPLRKAWWLQLWVAIKVGFLVFIGLAILVFWTGRDLRDAGDRDPLPSKVSPAPKRSK